MTRQYKNPFEDPEAEFYGKKVKDYKIPKRRKTPLEGRFPGYIYVPKIKLYVAKEKSLRGLRWEDAHKKLHEQGLQMLTIRQFIDFIFYLKKNKSKIPDAKKILDEILTKRGPYRVEWLDARFSEEAVLAKKGRLRGGIPIKDVMYSGDFGWPGDDIDDKPSKKAEKLYMHYNHRIIDRDYGQFVSHELVAQNKEPLEKCLMEDCYIDLKSCNKQGLPTNEGKGALYSPPEGDCVAAFITDSDGPPALMCDLNNLATRCEGQSVGVRAALKKEEKK